MINIIEYLLQEHNILLAQLIIQHPLAVHINLTPVVANAVLVLTTPLLNAGNHLTVLF